MNVNKIVGFILVGLSMIVLTIGYLGDPSMSNWKFAYVFSGGLSALGIRSLFEKEKL